MEPRGRRGGPRAEILGPAPRTPMPVTSSTC